MSSRLGSISYWRGASSASPLPPTTPPPAPPPPKPLEGWSCSCCVRPLFLTRPSADRARAPPAGGWERLAEPPQRLGAQLWAKDLRAGVSSVVFIKTAF